MKWCLSFLGSSFGGSGGGFFDECPKRYEEGSWDRHFSPWGPMDHLGRGPFTRNSVERGLSGRHLSLWVLCEGSLKGGLPYWVS
jgi:hypothetical protein